MDMLKVKVILPLVVFVLILASACAPGATAPQPTPTTPPPTAKPAAVAPTAAPATPTTIPATAKPAAVVVKVGHTAGSLGDAPLYVAQEKGYFAEQGLKVEVIDFQSAGSEAMAPLSTGDIDAVDGGWSLTTVNAVLRGIPLLMVADGQSKQPGFTGFWLSIRKDLHDSGQIKQIADLKGRKIGVSSVASMATLLVPTLGQANLTVKDIDMVALNYADMVASLANKSIDAAVINEPLVTQAVEQGLAVRFKDTWDVDPSPSSGNMIFGPKFSGNVDAGNRFVLAYIKGTRDYTDAFLKNKGKKEMVDILVKYAAVKDPALYQNMGMPGFNPDGYMDVKSMEWTLKYWLSTGELKESVDINKLVDHRFVDNAIQKLGKYVR